LSKQNWKCLCVFGSLSDSEGEDSQVNLSIIVYNKGKNRVCNRTGK